MRSDLFKAVQTLAKEKQALLTRQERLVATLRASLGRLGYRLEDVTSKASRPPQSGKSPRRPAGVTGPFACPECGRTFALPLHLGRHVSATHPMKKAGRKRGNAGQGVRANTRRKPPRRG
jgi:hypothetical protein